jgi:hypothetical protein
MANRSIDGEIFIYDGGKQKMNASRFQILNVKIDVRKEVNLY